MTPSQAYSQMTSERTHMSGSNQTKYDLSIAVLQNTNTTITKDQAMQNLNDLYWDETGITDKNNFGQAAFCIAYMTDPSRPYPTVRA